MSDFLSNPGDLALALEFKRLEERVRVLECALMSTVRALELSHDARNVPAHAKERALEEAHKALEGKP